MTECSSILAATTQLFEQIITQKQTNNDYYNFHYAPSIEQMRPCGIVLLTKSEMYAVWTANGSGVIGFLFADLFE